MKGLCKEGNFHTVLGDSDTPSGDVTARKKIDVNGVKIGMIHGHQISPWDDPESLKNVEREIDCDILLHGHTHKAGVRRIGNSFAVNPGSATGAYGPLEV